MKLNRQRTDYSLTILAVVLLFLVTSCDTAALSQEATDEVISQPLGEQPSVAYGASLSEWEEGTQAENMPSTNSEIEADVWPSPSNDDKPATEETVSDEADSDKSIDGDASDEEIAASDEEILFELDNVVYRQLLWDGLIPADFTPTAVMAKYMDEIVAIEDGSPEANELYEKIQEEFNNAPVNEVINEVEIRLPGFIAPLDYTGDLITEFLLVPYFGACIHVPPPPANQTVLVTTAEGHGIKIEDSYNPIWVMGKIETEGTTTELAAAGYNIQEAIIELYMITE